MPIGKHGISSQNHCGSLIEKKSNLLTVKKTFVRGVTDMGCIYEENFGEGKCSMWDEDIEMNGCDEDGVCICSDDPDPSVMCEMYESDNKCFECCVDLNVEECQCEELDL